jgi:hypothetical protein
MHDVQISEQPMTTEAGKVWRRTYATPVGSVFQDEIRYPGYCQWHGARGWKDIQPWQTQHLIKGPEDYPVVKFIVEHTEYQADYFPIEQAKDWVGDDGIVIDMQPHSPVQMLMIDWVGSEQGRFFIHHARYRELVEDLYQAIARSREPMYEIGAKSPADIIWFFDNVDGVLVNPRLFEKYFIPEYEKMARVCHDHGKLLACHMDGRIGVLKELIGRSPLDIIEAFHPPPLGDLPLGEALALWPDKVIWVGFPGTVYSLGPEATRKYALDLLKEVIPGERVAIAMSTENLVSNNNLLALTSVLERAELPLR